jgi:hypothetical protein
MRDSFQNGHNGVLIAVCLVAALASPLMAQTAGMGTLTGRVIDSSGKAAVVNTTVTATSIETGQVRSANAGTNGSYKFEELPSGHYNVKFEAAGFKAAQTPSVTINGTETVVLDEMLERSEQSNSKSRAPQENLPNAPSSSTKEPSLGDLGFPAAETQGNAKEQALLDKRTHMLKIHQRMGLITTIPMIAAIFSSAGAGGKSTGSTGRDLHLALGAAAGDLYGITAYYAIRAPKIPGTQTRGPIRVHKALAWIHGPGMILTPILGAMAFDQKSKGERVHGLASAHMPVAIVTAGAFGAALMSVSFKF